MAAATYTGTITEFEPKSVKWDAYIKRCMAFFTTNRIKEMEKQRAMLITVMGDKAFKALQNLLTPTLQLEVPFKEIVTKLKEYFLEPDNMNRNMALTQALQGLMSIHRSSVTAMSHSYQICYCKYHLTSLNSTGSWNCG